MKKFIILLLFFTNFISSCTNEDFEMEKLIDSPIVANWETKRYFSTNKSGSDYVFRSNGTYLYTIQVKLQSGYDYLFESGTYEVLNEINIDGVTYGTLILYTDNNRTEQTYEIKPCDVCEKMTLTIYDKYETTYHIAN